MPLGPGKPIVLTFDNGYESQYTNALPVLKQLGWVADENMQLSGLPPSQGGLTTIRSRAWSPPAGSSTPRASATPIWSRSIPAELRIRSRRRARSCAAATASPSNWFCYPSGHYNPTVIDAVRAAGFVGSTTVEPGWAGPHSDPFRLPRLRVLGGTSPSALLSQISSAQGDGPPPSSYGT